MLTLTREDLQTMGFGPSQSADIIRRAKKYMCMQGYGYYESKRLGRVPVTAVEKILGFSITELEDKTNA